MSQAGILDIESANPQIPTSFVTNDGVAVPLANVLEILGTSVPAGTTPVETTGSGNTITIEVQTAQAIASTNATNIGLAAFNSAEFNVDANGFVSLDNPFEDLTITGDTGGALSPIANNWNILGQGTPNTSGIQLNGAGATLNARMFSPYTLGDFLFNNTTLATKRTVEVRNSAGDALSDSVMVVKIAGANTSDAYYQVGQGSTNIYCFGTDTSDSNTLKICQDANANTATPSGGTLLWKMTTAGAASYVAGNLDVTRSVAGTVSMTVSNTDNAPGAKAFVDINVAGTSADDPYIRFEISGDATNQWAMGMDNSDTQAFCLTHSSVLGGTNIFRVDKSSSSTLFQAGNLGVSVGSGGGTPTLSVANTSNTASSNALQQVTVAGTSAGDPFTTYTITGTTNWSIGADNSVAGDPFVIAASTALGTSNVMSITTAGVITLTAPLPETSGGTNQSTYATGDLLYASGVNTLAKRTIGSSSQVLTVTGGVPAWSTATFPVVAGSAGTLLRSDGTNWVATTSTYPNTNAINTLLYASSANVMTALATATTAVLTTSSGVPTWANQLSLALGGTNAALTASNGGIFYSTASAGAILSGTATAGQMLQSGASTTPAWSTSTYPATNAINTLLYASSANVMAALATANNGVLITSSGGVPSISSTLPSAVQGNITSVGNLGNQLNTTRCVFFANLGSNDSNVTGDGTIYTFGSGNALTVTQQGSAMATNGTFTAPVTGWYHFDVNIALTGATTATDAYVSLGGTGGNLIPWRNLPKDTNNSSINTSFTINVTSGNTITVTITVSGLTKTVGISGASNGQSTFSGYLVT